MDNRPICEPIELPSGVHVLTEVVSFGATSPPPARLAHFHSLCEIVWFRRCHGSFIAEDKSERVEDWSAVYVPSMHMHDFDLNHGVKEWVLIQFEPFLAQDLGTRVSDHLLKRAFLSRPNPADRERIDMLVGWLVENCAASPGQPLSGKLIELILTLMSSSGTVIRDGESKTSRQLDRLRPAIEKIHNQPDYPLSLDEASVACNLSAAYFSRSFKQVVGQNFHDYKRTYRLNLAARRLLSTGMQVSKIAYSLGFSSPAHFAAVFHKRFGVTPRAYRNGRRAIDDLKSAAQR